MYCVGSALARYLQFNIRALDIEQPIQGLTDFARECRDTPSLSSHILLDDGYKIYVTLTGKTFRWLDNITSLHEPNKQDILRGIVAFANLIKTLGLAQGDEVMFSFMLAFKPVIVSCATCVGQCETCFGPGGRYEHIGDAVRAQGDDVQGMSS
jgi:hypothetical protein